MSNLYDIPLIKIYLIVGHFVINNSIMNKYEYTQFSNDVYKLLKVKIEKQVNK